MAAAENGGIFMQKNRLIAMIIGMVMIFNLTGSVSVFAEESTAVYNNEGYAVSYSVVSEWGNNQNVVIKIENTGNEVIENWAVEYDAGGTISGLWNVQIYDQENTDYILKNTGYNHAINVGESIEFGYTVTGDSLKTPERINICTETVDITEECDVNYNVVNDFGDSYQAEIEICNNTGRDIESWKLITDTAADVRTVWNADVSKVDDKACTFVNDENTYKIEAGGKITISIAGDKENDGEVIFDNFRLSTVEIIGHNGNKEDDYTYTPWLPEGMDILIACAEYSNETLYFEWTYVDNKRVFTIYENTENGKVKIADVQDASAYEYHIGKITGSRQFTVETIDNNGITVGSDPITVYIDEEELVQIEYPDSDSDGVADIFEHIYGTDPEKYDTDSDGLNDYEEIYLFGTDPLAADSDNDNLPDGFEIYQTGTDPLIKDSIGEGKTDDVYDMDNDGLTNYQEYKYGTNPLNDDTDGDGLDDHSEIFTHKTDPLLVDTDSDNVCDGDEIALGLDPNAPQTHGCPDSKYTLVQKLDYNSEKLSEINDSANNPFDISVEMDCAGLIENNLKAYESGYTSAIENESIVGIVPEISYPEDLEIKSFKLTFKLDSSAVVNTNDCHNEEDTEFEGIERFTVFKMFEDYNMLLPVETYYNTGSNEVYAKTDAAGTYCLVDTELWVDMLEKQMDSYTGYYDSEGELSEDFMEENVSGKLTDEVSAFSDNLVISSMYSAGDTNKKTIVFIYEKQNKKKAEDYIRNLKIIVNNKSKGNEVTYDAKEGVTNEGTFIVTDSIQQSMESLIENKKNNKDNVFFFIIFDGDNAKYDKKAGYTLINELVSNNIDVSLVSNPSKIENYDYGMTLTKETGGIVINTNYNNDENVAEKMYRHVFGDSDGGDEYGIILVDPCNYKTIKLKKEITKEYLENAKKTFFEIDDRTIDDINKDKDYVYIDSDNDNLYDFEEIRFFWDEDKNEQTITWENNEAVFPEFSEVCTKLNEKYGFIDEKYVTDLKTKYSIDDSTRILPIWSDPTSEDGDVDGITDYNERVAIEEYKGYEQYKKNNQGADIREYYACTLDPIKRDTLQTIFSELNNDSKSIATSSLTFGKASAGSNANTSTDAAVSINVTDNNVTIDVKAFIPNTFSYQLEDSKVYIFKNGCTITFEDDVKFTYNSDCEVTVAKRSGGKPQIQKIKNRPTKTYLKGDTITINANKNPEVKVKCVNVDKAMITCDNMLSNNNALKKSIERAILAWKISGSGSSYDFYPGLKFGVDVNVKFSSNSTNALKISLVNFIKKDSNGTTTPDPDPEPNSNDNIKYIVCTIDKDPQTICLLMRLQ